MHIRFTEQGGRLGPLESPVGMCQDAIWGWDGQLGRGSRAVLVRMVLEGV